MRSMERLSREVWDTDLWSGSTARITQISAVVVLKCLGFLRDPEILGKMMGLEPFEMYKVRTATGWISPLNHAVYGRHNFGYDHLPTVGQSCMVFFLILCILAFLSFRVLKRYPLSKSRVI